MADNTDIPVEIHGYATDPKRVGFQLVTNYESTYWRPLVGSDAWSFYEILRSFCHQGNNVCDPTIRLLTSILGIKDRNALTGRTKRVKGKVYEYPGLIAILEEHNLVKSQLIGPNGRQSYVFRVNLTPGLLTSEQLSELPKMLQKRHDWLLERWQREMQEFEAEDPPYGNSTGGGMEIPQGDYGNSTPITTPNTQHPNSTTEAGEKDNNNSSGDQKQDVVVALTDIGISKRVANRLASRYSRDRVFEKIDFLEFLQSEDPAKIKSPRGWLRTAIEQNYGPPDGYKSKEEREAEARRQQEEAEAQAQQEAKREQRQQELLEEQRRQREEVLEELKDTYGTSGRESDLWKAACDELQLQMPKATFTAWIAQSHLLALNDDGVAIIGVVNDYAKDWLEQRLANKVRRTLQGIAEREVVEIRCEVLEAEALSVARGDS